MIHALKIFIRKLFSFLSSCRVEKETFSRNSSNIQTMQVGNKRVIKIAQNFICLILSWDITQAYNWFHGKNVAKLNLVKTMVLDAIELSTKLRFATYGYSRILQQLSNCSWFFRRNFGTRWTLANSISIVRILYPLINWNIKRTTKICWLRFQFFCFRKIWIMKDIGKERKKCQNVSNIIPYLFM